MKIEDAEIVAQYCRALKELPAVRKECRPDRKMADGYDTHGLELSYFAQESGGGSGSGGPLIPLALAPEIFEHVETLLRRELTRLGVTIE